MATVALRAWRPTRPRPTFSRRIRLLHRQLALERHPLLSALGQSDASERPPRSISSSSGPRTASSSSPKAGDYSRNMLSICIQPDEGIHLTIEAKIPDQQIAKSVDMELAL